MSGLWRRVSGGATGKWSFWKFNWLANHKIIRALEQARPHAKGELLDMGCGAKPFAPIFEGQVTRYWGTDLSQSQYLGGARLDAFAKELLEERWKKVTGDKVPTLPAARIG